MRDARPPPRASKFFQFHAVLGEFGKITPPCSVHAHLGQILDPPLHFSVKCYSLLNNTPWRHFEILQNACQSYSEVLATYFHTVYQQAAVTRKLFNCKSSDWAEIKKINRIRNISQPSGIIAHPHRSHEITRDYTRQIPGLLANELVIKDEQ